MYLPIPLPKEMMSISSKCSNTLLSVPSEALWNKNGDSSLSALVEILNQESGAWVQGWIFSIDSFSPKHLILRLNHETVNGGPSKETVRNGNVVTARRIWRIPPPHLPVPGLHPPNRSITEGLCWAKRNCTRRSIHWESRHALCDVTLIWETSGHIKTLSLRVGMVPLIDGIMNHARSLTKYQIWSVVSGQTYDLFSHQWGGAKLHAELF